MIKTLDLDGFATVTIDAAHAHIRNDSADTRVCVATHPDPIEGEDGVLIIPPGQAAALYNCEGTIYLDGIGPAVVVSSDYVTSPFKCAPAAASGGGSDITTDAAGIVTLYDLQGGVPFSGITLDGDIEGQEITLRAGGENLLSFDNHAETETISGVTFTRCSDGSIIANGTATAVAQYLSDTVEMTGGETYTLTGCTAGGSLAGYSITNQTTANITDLGAGKTFTYDAVTFGAPRFKIRIAAGYTCDNVIFRPVLCSGEAVITKITPDTTPYTVPDDIRQQDGVNTVSVSAGDVIVEGVRRNAALGKVWEKLDSLM